MQIKLIIPHSFHEEGIVLPLVFCSSSNRPLLFKAHACTGGISRDRFPAISLAQRQNLFDMLSRTTGRVLSVGSAKVLVLLPL